jgi:hypothetical protein
LRQRRIPLRTIWVVESGGLCGGVKVIFEYASRLKKRGHDVIIATVDPHGVPNWFDLGDVQWWQFPSYQAMDEKLKTERGKKIATWWRTSHLVKNVISEGEGYYLVADIESSYYFRPGEQAEVLETYNYPLKHFTHSPYVQKVMPEATYVCLAIDPNLYKPLPLAYPARKRALSIVRKQALKGYTQLGEFARELSKLDKEAELVTWGMDKYVGFGGAFHGRHYVLPTDKDIVRLYSEGSCYVCSSLREGFGLPLIEAMSCGCPTVTFFCDGNIFCKNEENSLVVERGNAPALAEAAYRVMMDEPLRKKLVKNGFETAREYSNWDKVIDKLETFLSN